MLGNLEFDCKQNTCLPALKAYIILNFQKKATVMRFLLEKKNN